MDRLGLERYSSGNNIFQEGELGNKMYVVKEGEVELSVHGKIIVRVGKGGILGEMALIDNKPRSATAWAKTNCQLVPIDEQGFLTLVHQNPEFSLEVMKVLVERLRLMNQRV